MNAARFVTMFSGISTALAAGCSSARNDRLGAGEETLPAFRLIETNRLASDDAPSTGGVLDRSGWAPIVMHVPVDATFHRPTYRLPAWRPDASPTARQRGVHPDASSALETRGDAGARVVEAFVAPLGAAAEIALFPIHVFITPVWKDAASPAWGYERWPRSAEPESASMERTP